MGFCALVILWCTENTVISNAADVVFVKKSLPFLFSYYLENTYWQWTMRPQRRHGHARIIVWPAMLLDLSDKLWLTTSAIYCIISWSWWQLAAKQFLSTVAGTVCTPKLPPLLIQCPRAPRPCHTVVPAPHSALSIGLSYRPASLCSLAAQFQTRFLESILRPKAGLKFPTQYTH